MGSDAIEVPRGLAGVVVTDTDLGDVRGQDGVYHYRQYSAIDLAERRTCEDVWDLMNHGALPDAAARAAFTDEATTLRTVPDDVSADMPAIARASGTAGPLA